MKDNRLDDVEFLEKVTKESKNYSEVARKFGYKPGGGTHKLLLGRIKKYGIDCSHFKGQSWSQGLNSFIDNRVKRYSKKDFLQIFKKDNFNQSNVIVIRMLICEKKLEYKCNVCGIKKWNEKPLRLRLDHINGDCFDYREENLRLICPNCDSQSDTFCRGKKKKNKSKQWWHFLSNSEIILPKHSCAKKVILFKNGPCTICGEEMGKSKFRICRKCLSIKNRKVERPTHDQLLKDVSEMNFVSIGKKYGVSDNAIRKWIKSYENS